MCACPREAWGQGPEKPPGPHMGAWHRPLWGGEQGPFRDPGFRGADKMPTTETDLRSSSPNLARCLKSQTSRGRHGRCHSSTSLCWDWSVLLGHVKLPMSQTGLSTNKKGQLHQWWADRTTFLGEGSSAAQVLFTQPFVKRCGTAGGKGGLSCV